MKLLVCITVGLAIFILLFSACWYCRVRNAHASWPVENIERGDKQERGANNNRPIYENNDHDPAIYYNDLTGIHLQLPGILPAVARNELSQSGNEHDPAKNEGNPAKRGSQRRRQGFHRELISRLRQASLSRHHYVNQAQLNQQAASSEMENRVRASFWRKKGKQKCRYENPIYNNSTEHLNNQY
ncbi:uncharacterized protein ACJ7VT_002351 [Polymixia lowei]